MTFRSEVAESLSGGRVFLTLNIQFLLLPPFTVTVLLLQSGVMVAAGINTVYGLLENTSEEWLLFVSFHKHHHNHIYNGGGNAAACCEEYVVVHSGVFCIDPIILVGEHNVRAVRRRAFVHALSPQVGYHI